jgi:hypothetical protein
MSVNAARTKLDELLKPLGFRRRSSTWNRRAGQVVDVVDVQISKAGDTATVNAGVMDTNVYAMVWGREPSGFVQTLECTVAVRIGPLMDGKDRWWPLEQGQILEMAEQVAKHALPFLDRIRSRARMAQWLVDADVTMKKYPFPILHLAILKKFLGCDAEACALLAMLRKRSMGAWQDRVLEVAARLGCT